MNDFVVKVSKLNRSVSSCESFIGLDGENLVENLIFIFTDTFVDGNARLEYIVNDEKYFIELIKGNNYYSIPIKNVITKEGNIEMQLVISKQGENNEIIVFKSDIFTVYCKKSINAVEDAPDGYVVWLDHANEILRQMENLNIIAYKENGITYVVVTSKEGVSTTYQIKDGKNGKNGIDGEKGEDGNGIIKIEKTGTVDNVDTYTIYYTNGTTSTFTVTNSTVTDEEFEALQEEVNKYKTLANILPRVSGTGTDLSLSNTGEGTPLEIDLEGQTSQDSTTGKQLFDKNSGTTQNGGTKTINGEKINITGQNGFSGVYWDFDVTGLNTINVKGAIISGTYSKILVLVDGSSKKSSETIGNFDFTISLSSNTLLRVILYGNKGSALEEQTTSVYEDIMVSTSGGDYEPYTGGIPAPNPDYPYPIKKVTGDNNVKVQNKNLISSVARSNNVLYFNGSNENIYPFKAGTYTISYSDTNNCSLYYKTANTSSTSLGSNKTVTFTINEDFNVWLYRSGMTDNEVSNIQLEKGSTSTTFVEHKEQNFPITMGSLEAYDTDEFMQNSGKNMLITNVINFTGNTTNTLQINGSLDIGTYTFSGEGISGDGRFNLYGITEDNTQEYLLQNQLTKNIPNGYTFTTTKVYKSISLYTNVNLSGNIMLETGSSLTDYEPYGTGEWYLKNYWKLLTLNGTENWGYASNILYATILERKPSTTSSQNIYCTNYSFGGNSTSVANANTNMSNYQIGTNNNGTSKSIFIKDTDYTSAESFKTYLAEHNLTILIELATPTFTKITDTTLITELNNLKNNAMSYKDVTNINQTNDELPFIITASGFKDLSNL